MNFKTTYYQNGRLDIAKTIKSHAAYHAYWYGQKLKYKVSRLTAQ